MSDNPDEAEQVAKSKETLAENARILEDCAQRVREARAAGDWVREQEALSEWRFLKQREAQLRNVLIKTPWWQDALKILGAVAALFLIFELFGVIGILAAFVGIFWLDSWWRKRQEP